MAAGTTLGLCSTGRRHDGRDHHPELNPIELAWSKMKALLKRIGARDLPSLASTRKPSSPSWRAFLDNHVKDPVAIDFFTVPTATFGVCSGSWRWPTTGDGCCTST
jgi:hypothetical protein